METVEKDRTRPVGEDVPGVRSATEAASSEGKIASTARIAGLKGFTQPTLERIDRRRIELLAITMFLLVSLAVGTVLLSYADDSPDWFTTFGGTLTAVRVGLVAIVCGFIVYVLDKERQLSKLSKYVVNEQVLSAALSNRLKEISLLSDAGKAVSSSLELEDVLGVILNAAFELLEADEGSVMLLEGDELVVAAAAGHPRLFVGDRKPLDDGLAGYVARTREPLLIEGSVGPETHSDVRRGNEIASAMSVPMEARSQLLGILNLNVTVGERRYSEYELRALGLFAEHAGMAIRHARTMSREREMRMHVAEMDRLRTELVGSMAHDLKTPLTSIIGVSKVLEDRADQLTDNQRVDFTRSIGRQAQRLLALIERLLDAARSQAQHLPLAPGLLDLTPQVEEIARGYSEAYGRRIDVESAGPERVQVFADSDALEQVIANLLENAVRHTPADAVIAIHLSSDASQATIRVSDEGPGIAPEIMESLFAPFRRGAARGTGTGLGLFVVSNLMRAMGGSIDVDTKPGEGTSFILTLPVQQKEPGRAGSQT